jgi:hypothetical protein
MCMIYWATRRGISEHTSLAMIACTTESAGGMCPTLFLNASGVAGDSMRLIGVPYRYPQHKQLLSHVDE